MSIVGINSEVKNNSVALALRKSGYKLRVQKVSWPRRKGPAAIRLDCTTLACRNMHFVVK